MQLIADKIRPSAISPQIAFRGFDSFLRYRDWMIVSFPS